MSPLDFIHQYEKALSSQQWENVAPLIHEQACVTFSTGHVHRGKNAIEKAYKNNFDLIQNETYVMEDLHWAMQTKEFAVYTFSFKWSGWIGGKHAEGSGKGTCTLICENNRWLLLAEHLGK